MSLIRYKEGRGAHLRGHPAPNRGDFIDAEDLESLAIVEADAAVDSSHPTYSASASWLILIVRDACTEKRDLTRGRG